MNNPVTPQVTRTFEDINGIKHQSYGEAYQASVRTKLAKIITYHRQAGVLNNHTIADAIMKEMVVAWG